METDYVLFSGEGARDPTAKCDLDGALVVIITSSGAYYP